MMLILTTEPKNHPAITARIFLKVEFIIKVVLRCQSNQISRKLPKTKKA
jgi:hypothetical protein